MKCKLVHPDGRGLFATWQWEMPSQEDPRQMHYS